MFSTATTAMTTLTPAFIHYFPSRNAISDPYSCFVYLTSEMTATLGGGEPAHFTLSYPKKGPNLTFHNDPFKRSNPTSGDYTFRREVYMGTFRFKPDDPTAGDHVRELDVHQWDIDIRDSMGAKIPVLMINKVNRLFKGTLKRNLLLFAAAGVTVSSRNPEPVAPPPSAPASAPVKQPSAETSTYIQHLKEAASIALTSMKKASTASDSSAAVTELQTAMSHVKSTLAKIPTPKLKAKKVLPPVPAAPPHGDLRPFVAKQLLELAQLKKEMCPITAEEYYSGETAVMPCGHLFMRIAIEESFKKEPGKCPACRQPGRPTYV